ncbi:nucleoside triphosphate pyrophosphohydrolase [soil metagenome]
MSPSSEIARLVEIMRRLRDPETGCPWDIAQDFASIAPFTIEEASEVADAIERGDLAALKEELGDLLLQVVYHARLAEEAGAFAFGDVTAAICDKMVRRHPHVFGTERRDQARAQQSRDKTPDEQSRDWESLKAAERATTASSVLDGVASALPGLTRAVKLQNRAARVGFDWPGAGPVLDKLDEEAAELSGAQDEAASFEEFGDLLFVLANLARHWKIDPEAALRAANAKFTRRFQRVEAALAAEGRSPVESDLAEMDSLWDAAKAEERERAGD